MIAPTGPGLLLYLFSAISLLGWCKGKADDFDVDFLAPPTPSSFVRLKIYQSFSDLSVCLWIKNSFVASGGVPQGLLCYNNKVHQSFTLMLDGKGLAIHVQPFQSATGVDSPTAKTNTSVRDGSWHEVCGVWNQEGLLQLLIDGEKDTVAVFNAWPKAQVIAGGGSLVIGHSHGPSCENFASFQGSFSRLNIWDRPLTADEVNRMFRECSPKSALPANLLTWEKDLFITGMNGSVVISSYSVTCSPTSTNGNFLQMPGMRLRGHVIKHKASKDLLSCAHHCFRNLACLSFNVLRRYDWLICELMTDSKETTPHKMEMTPTSDHYFIW